VRQRLGKIVWLTGNSGAGKSSLANCVCDHIDNWINLDGDEMRASISLGAGFSKEDREEHNLRVARLAKVLSSKGHNVIVSVIAPFQSTRDKIDKVIECTWVYLKRDSVPDKDRPYEEPHNALTINVNDMTVEEEYEFLMNQIGTVI